ncbi:MAG: DUF111 family protein [bacterium]|nr:DUF111 family protein [bacterium]
MQRIHFIEKEKEKEAVGIIFSETTTGGIRRSVVERWLLERKNEMLSTEHGDVSVKRLGNKGILEYEDIKKIAKDKQIPLITLMKKHSNSNYGVH